MDNSIIKIPLYSVDEGDILNKSSLQKSFQQAICRMYDKKGMYVKYDREVHYLKTFRKIVRLKNVRFFVFGVVFKISVAKLKFPSLLNWLKELEELGFDEVAYNASLKKMMPFNDEQMVILSENAVKNLSKKTPVDLGSKQEWLLSEPLFKPMSLNQTNFKLNVFSETLKLMKFDSFKFQGIEVYKQIYYVNGCSEIEFSRCLYVFDDCIVGKNLLRNMFSRDKAMLRKIDNALGEQMIMDNEKNLLPLTKECIPIRRMCLNKWIN